MSGTLVGSYQTSNRNTQRQEVASIEHKPDEAFLKLDSKSRYGTSDNVNFNLTPSGKYFTMRGEVKLAVTDVHFPWFIPNVTPRNNKVTFLIGPTRYETTLAPGFYSLTDFCPAFETALNAIPGLPTTFTVTLGNDISGYSITVANATVFFPERSANQNRNLWDWVGYNYLNSVFTNSITNIPKPYYTRYVDIISHDIHKHTTLIDEATNFASSDILVRVHGNDSRSDPIITPTEPGGLFCTPHTTTFEVKNPKWVKWEPSDTLGGSIDCQLADEFGDVLWVPDPTNNWDWTLGMLARASV